MAEVEVTEAVRAEPSVVYDLISDVTRMGSWSPETTSCRWLSDAIGPTVGARFRGTNRHGPLLRLDPTATGCIVTESWEDRRVRALRVASIPIMGIADRAGTTAAACRPPSPPCG